MDLDIEEKSGDTTAKIQEIISCIQLRNCKHIIVTTATMKIAEQYRSLLSTQADREGLSFYWYSPYDGYVGNVVVRFKLKNESLNGYDDYYLVEMDY